MDLYLEGSDQHRGWFHSSLLMSEALYARAPYRGVLTHGFTVDEKGRKMSKSLGNGIEPQDITRTLGADMLRLWVAATDFANEMSLSQEILKRMSDSYRRMRNTVRFLLGNMHGFEPAQALPVGANCWPWMPTCSERTRELHAEVAAAYRDYQFHLIYQKVHNFCVVDLGGFYLDIIKDRLYTTPAGQPRAPLGADRDVAHRRGDGALAGADPLVHGRGNLAPAARRARRVGVPEHLVRRCRRRRSAAAAPIDWPALIALRTDVARELERLRVAGEIGAPLAGRAGRVLHRRRSTRGSMRSATNCDS